VIANWPCPLPAGGHLEEFALSIDRSRQKRLLVLPALFDEANKTRRQLVEVMRRLDRAGIDCLLPDLPGWNESPQPLHQQTLTGWREAAQAAALHFGATNLLTIRASAVIAPPRLKGWRYAPTGGANALRALLRSRQVAAREAGREERMDDLMEQGRKDGIELAGYRFGPALFAELEASRLPDSGVLADIGQGTIGGSGPWLRAEPGFAPEQADALAAVISVGMVA
jgi:hypothetical protein